MAFSIPGDNQRSTKSRQKPQPFHWVGIDVSKPFFDAAVLSVPDWQTGVPVRELPVKRFPRTRAGAKKICGAARINIARGDGSLGDPRGDGIDGKVFERIGRLARRRALAVVRGDCESRTGGEIYPKTSPRLKPKRASKSRKLKRSARTSHCPRVFMGRVSPLP